MKKKRLPKSMQGKQNFINRYKLMKGCTLCGYKEHSAALQFDHIIPGEKHEKLKNHSKWGTKRSVIHLAWDTMKEEIRKCRVLCANCHSVETQRQGHNKWRRT